MSRFLRDNVFQLIFRGSYKRINHRKKLSVGRWKAKLLDNKSDWIIGFTKFSKPESSKTYHNGAVYIDSNRNKIYDDTSSDHAVYDKRIPTSYRSLDYTKKMIKMQKGKVKVWFSKQAKIPYLNEYADGYYKIRITDNKSGEDYDYDSYKSGFEELIREVFGVHIV